MSSKTEKATAVHVGIKIHELSKQIGVASKDIVAKANELGIKSVKGPASVLTAGQADRLKAKLGGAQVVQKLKAEVEEHKTSQRRPAVNSHGEEVVSSRPEWGGDDDISDAASVVLEETEPSEEQTHEGQTDASTEDTSSEETTDSGSDTSTQDVDTESEVSDTEAASAFQATHTQSDQHQTDTQAGASSSSELPSTEVPSTSVSQPTENTDGSPTEESTRITQGAVSDTESTESSANSASSETGTGSSASRFGVVVPAPPPPPPRPATPVVKGAKGTGTAVGKPGTKSVSAKAKPGTTVQAGRHVAATKGATGNKKPSPSTKPALPAVIAPPVAQKPYVPPIPLSALPKRVLTGPEVAPPIRRPAPKLDPRFGVVVNAVEAEKLHGPLKKPDTQPKPAGRKGPVQVESKQPVDDFKPQVSYPSLPGGASSDDGDHRRGGASAVGTKRSVFRGAPGVKGFSSGPRRGVALMRDDDRYRGGRRHKHRPLPVKPVILRTGPAEVTSPVSIKDLCEALGIKANTLIKKFFEQGKMVTVNSILADDDSMLYALEFDPLKFGVTIKKARDVEEEMLKRAEVSDKPEELKSRAPVVTIMGHVDHGKTSLLDFIRNAKVAAGEAGGITQHIGAYKVQHTKGDIAFLDTPGHKAFTEMRARGANVTDIVILVVSAVDGVMPQTEEAISHARQANKKLIVAINKIDLPEANVDRIKGQLATKELYVEGYGGEVGCVEVSAKTGQGIDDLLDRVLLEAEILELKANPDKQAGGTVVEAHKDQGRGIVSTLLVQEGTLKHGDIIICGHAYGSVRQIFSSAGKVVKEAGPSTPVLVTGLSDVPLSGERFHILDSIKHAAEIANQRAMRLRQEGLIKRTHVTLETLSDMLAQGAVVSLKLVLKVDVMGSLAPLRNAIGEMNSGDARIDILHDGVGAINETDVLLADASDAIVIGFNVTADPGARRMAEERSVEIRSYQIIYDVVDEVRKALEGILKPIDKEVVQGTVTVRATFKISKIGTIAGCMVDDGVITRNASVRLIRDGKPVWTGRLLSLKREKDDAKEVRSGFECGLKLEDFDDVKQGDTIESFVTEQVKRTLSS